MNKIVFLAFLTFTCLFPVESMDPDLAKEFQSFMQKKFCKAKKMGDKHMFIECAAMLPRTGLQIMKKAARAKSVFEAFVHMCNSKEITKKVCDALTTQFKDFMDEQKREEIMECMMSNSL